MYDICREVKFCSYNSESKWNFSVGSTGRKSATMTSLPPIDKKRSNSYTNPQTQTRKRTVSEPPVAINQDKDIMQELLDQRKQILTRKQEKSILVHIGYFVVTIGMLVVQFRDRNSLNFFIQWNEYFSTAKFAFPGLPGIPFSTLDFCGSLMACRRYRIAIRLQRGRKSWFETLVASTLLQFGGTTLTGMFLGQIPSWTLGNHVFVALLLAWWLTFFSPFDIYWKLTKNSNLFYFSVGSLAGTILNTIHTIHTIHCTHYKLYEGSS